MHKKNIEHIIKHGTLSQMEDLKEVLECVIVDLKHIDYEKYIDYEIWIHKIVYGSHLGKDLALCWVDKMLNKDGTKGAHWTYEQVEKVAKDKDIKANINDFYAVLNMMYSDFFNTKFDIMDYIGMAKDWLDDTDASECKTLKYYYHIVMK